MDALLKAVKEGNEEELIRLLDGDPTLLEGLDADTYRRLARAADHGQLGVVKVLLERGAEAIGTRLFLGGGTALHWAAAGGHEEILAWLLEQGAQANSKTANGTTPLMFACQEGHMGVVQLLLQHTGAQALLRTDDNGWTPLHWAADGGHEEMVVYLIAQGAQTNSRTVSGMTPFMCACKRGHVDVIRVLLRSMGGAALQEGSRDGGTALYWAVRGGHAGVVRLLLATGADPTIANNEGRTPRALAEEEGLEACAAAFEVSERYEVACVRATETLL
jgi:ankyrin repeat protein